MGYVLSKDAFARVLKQLGERYLLYAPAVKEGEGRFTDVDVIRYDFITEASELVLDRKSDYAFKELLTPLSETLFFFTEQETKEAERDTREVLVFARSCDIHALQRLDDIYLHNGRAADPFYRQVRERIHFALIGCGQSFADCFCVDMQSNRVEDGYLFSVDEKDGRFCCDVREDLVAELFAAEADAQEEVVPQFVTENAVHVSLPDTMPEAICTHPVWDEYSSRCINCGRCNFVCPTCTCYTMQDIFYTDNGKVGERRRVGASCMVDGYTNVAGGGQYRRTNRERMRFKVLHKILHHRKRFGHNMCVGCGRCDMVCPEYISYSACINKVNDAAKEVAAHDA